MTKVMTPNYTVSKGLMSLCSSWRICAWYNPSSGLYFTFSLYQDHTAHANSKESASLGHCKIFPMTCPDLEKSSIIDLLEQKHAPVLCPQFHLHKLLCIHYHSVLIKAVLVIHLCSGIHLSDCLHLVPHINNLRTVSFNVSSTQFQFNTQFSLRVGIVLLKLTWRGIKSFRRSYNPVLLIPQGAKPPSAIVKFLLRWKIIAI